MGRGEADDLSGVLVELVAHGSPEERGKALRFFLSLPRAAGHQALLELAERDLTGAMVRWPCPYQADRAFQYSPLAVLDAHLDQARASLARLEHLQREDET